VGSISDLQDSVLSYIDKVEREAVIILDNVGLKPSDAANVTVAVSPSVVGVVGVLPDILMQALAPSREGINVTLDGLELSLMKAMVAIDLLAYCSYFKYGCNPAANTATDILQSVTDKWLKAPNPWVVFKISRAIEKSLVTMGSRELLEEYASKKVSAHCSKAGSVCHNDKAPFQSDYREERKQGCSRKTVVSLLKKHYPSIPDSTLENWAKEADNSDGFVRKAGRKPKNNG